MKDSKIFKIRFIILIISIVLFGVLLFTGCDKKGDNNDDPNNGSGNDPISLVAPDYSMDVDFREDSEVKFNFKPRYSGRYILNYDQEEVAVSVDDLQVESGHEQYYNKNKDYCISYKKSGSESVVHGNLMPIENQLDQIRIESNNNYIVKFVPEKSGLFRVAATSGRITVLDPDYNSVKGLTEDVYRLKNDLNNFYYMVIENSSYSDSTISLSVEEEVLETIEVTEQSAESQAKGISGVAGESKLFILDVKYTGECQIAYNGISGNNKVKSAIFNVDSVNEVATNELIVGNNECIYKYANLTAGKYYLRLTFIEDASFELYFK